MAVDPMAMQMDPSQPDVSQLPAEEAPPEGQAPTEEQDASTPNPGIDLTLEITQAISAGCTSAKASATGQPEQIDPERYKAFADGVFALCQGLAKLNPPAPPVDPNKAQADATDAAKAALQDDQKDRELQVQLETARRREGRPSGPAKP